MQQPGAILIVAKALGFRSFRVAQAVDETSEAQARHGGAVVGYTSSCSQLGQREIGMARVSPEITEIERRMALVRANLAELTEQAAAYSGAADEDLASRRIAELEAELKDLTRQRDKLSRKRRS